MTYLSENIGLAANVKKDGPGYRIERHDLVRQGRRIGSFDRIAARREGRTIPTQATLEFAFIIAKDRAAARARGDFKEADQLRAALKYDGWTIEDMR